MTRHRYTHRHQLPHRLLAQDEAGFASLVVGLVLVVVLALLTVGFGQLSLHEQRQALNSALATQAYYAAESGIDDAIHDLTTFDPNIGQNYLNSGNISGVAPGAQCMKPGSLPAGAYTANNVVDSTNAVSYSCLLVGLVSNDLVYDNVAPGSSRTVLVKAPSLNKLTIAWGDPNVTSFATLPSLPTAPNWTNKPGVLQFSITPVGATFAQSNLDSGLFTTYAYPSTSSAGNPTNYTVANNQGKIVGGGCSNANTPQCSVTINGIPGASAYLIHFLDFYDPSDVTITGYNGGSPVTFTGGQATIDVTGRAKYVLKRLQVRVPLNSAVFPDYALQAQDICKRMETLPGSTSFVAPDGQPAGPNDAPFCGDSNTGQQKQAGITTGGGNGGGGGGGGCKTKPTGCPPRAYHFTIRFTNSSPAGETPKSCLWQFGDGGTYTGACQPGNTYAYTYHEPPNFTQSYPYPSGCHLFPETVNLTLYFAGGAQAQSTPANILVPNCY